MTQPSQLSSLQIRNGETFGVSAVDHNTMKVVETHSPHSGHSSNDKYTTKNIKIFDRNDENIPSQTSSPVGLKCQ